MKTLATWVFSPLAAFVGLVVSSVSWSTEMPNTDVYIGFLEADGPRRVFLLTKGAWQSALPDADSVEALNQDRNHVSKPEKWTVFYDGKVRGTVLAKPVTAVHAFKDVGLQQLVGKKPALPRQKIETQFSAFDGPRIRPLLLTTDPTVKDPDSWKPDRDKSLPPSAKTTFIRIFGDQAKHDSADEGTSAKSYRIQESEIILTNSYKTMAGTLAARVIGLKLQLSKSLKVSCETEGDRCQGAPTYWFYIPSGQAPIFLAKAAALIETADLNGDGFSDFAFWHSEYNLGGYSIVDGKTRALTQAHWSYH